MKTAAEIVREFNQRKAMEHSDANDGEPQELSAEEARRLWERRRLYLEERENSVEKYKKSYPSSEFNTKEERDRWGCRLSVATRGYSGWESGTKSVFRSIAEDRHLAVLNRNRKRIEVFNAQTRSEFERELFPKFIGMFNGNDSEGGYDFTTVPKVFIDRHQAARVAEYAKHRQWVRENPSFGIVVERMLWHIVKYGDYLSSPEKAYDTRLSKSRLVEAYHSVFGRSKDGGWMSIWEDRAARGEVRFAIQTSARENENGSKVWNYEWK